jgi:hypothetical protein
MVLDRPSIGALVPGHVALCRLLRHPNAAHRFHERRGKLLRSAAHYTWFTCPDRQIIHGTRVVVPAPSESTVVIMKEPEPGAVDKLVTASGLPKPDAAFVVNIGAPRNTTLSLRTSTPTTATALVPELIAATPANTAEVEPRTAIGDYHLSQAEQLK